MTQQSPRTPVVLLPGLDGTGKLFSPLVGALSPLNPVVINYPPDKRMDYSALTDFVALKLPRVPCLLVCESFSGPIGARLARLQPDRIAGLVFLGSFISAPRLRWMSALNELITYPCLPNSVIRFAMLGRIQKAQAEAFREVITSLPPDLVRHRIRLALSCDERASFGQTRCPVLSILGRSDLILGRSSVREIRTARPDTRSVLLDGPHLLALTRPEEVARETVKFAADL